MMDNDDDTWVKTAMKDVTIVANFLLTLNNNNKSKKNQRSLSIPLNLQWGVRQRRTNCHTSKPNNKSQQTRASPTTPLSWSAATSGSNATANTAATAVTVATVDGYEESSRFNKSAHSSRSKVDEQSEANANKKSRKKRSLPELLEEEKLLLTERGNLKDKLASMHLTVEKQKAKNESLKKMKLDLVSQNTTQTASTSLVSGKAVLNQPQLVDSNCGSSKLVSPQKVQEKESLVVTENASSSLQQEIRNQEPSFLLPDLNLPPEE